MREAIYQIPLVSRFDIRKELLLFDKIYLPLTIIEQRKSAFEKNGLFFEIDKMYAEIGFLSDHKQVEVIDIKETYSNTMRYLTNPEKLSKILESYSESEQVNFFTKVKYLKEKENFINDFFKLRPKLRSEINSKIQDPNLASKLLTYMSLREKNDASAVEITSSLLDIANEKGTVTPILSSERFFNKINKDNLNYFELLKEEEKNALIGSQPKVDVGNIVLKNLPIPEKDSPLEDIVNFKSDKENIRKLRDLNRWIKKVGESEMSKKEIEEEIEYLLEEYKRIMSKHKIKYNYTKAQIIVNMTLGTLEKLIKIQWSKLGDSFFELKKAKVDFELSESQAVGRELAYLYEIKEQIK